MTQQLISALYGGPQDGAPILVIGGGPRVLEDLPRLAIKPAMVIGANDHAMKQSFFKPDLLVNVDRYHTGRPNTPMEPFMRQFGVPIANVHSWADYRIPNWTLNMNTGLTCVALACALGGNPVIVTGLDMWGLPQRYFHSPEAAEARKPVRFNRAAQHPVRNHALKAVTQLLAFTLQGKAANIRPMSGPLLKFFPQYDPAEVLPEIRERMPYRVRTEVESVVYARPLAKTDFTHRDSVTPDTIIALSETEWNARQLRKGWTRAIVLGD